MPPRAQAFGPLGTTRYAVNGVPFDTVRVPPGRFVDGEGVEKRALLVSRPFEIGVTLVTQALWRAVTGASPSNMEGDDLPVEQVSWGDVQAFLGQLDVLGLRGFRLPTEAEWAWAARCGSTARWAGADRVKPVAVVNQGWPESVGSLRSSTVGAFDFSGNMREYQSDWWSNVPAVGVDTQGPASGSFRVDRGGSWYSFPNFMRIAYRGNFNPAHRIHILGLRLLRAAS